MTDKSTIWAERLNILDRVKDDLKIVLKDAIDFDMVAEAEYLHMALSNINNVLSKYITRKRQEGA